MNNLASKDFKIKYRRSILGVAWSILNPLLNMLVLTAVFSMLLGIKNYPDVGDFAVYYIVGAAMWNFFAEATTGAMTSVIFAAPLIKKVYIPKYIFPLEKCLFALINFCFSLIAVALVMIIRHEFINPGLSMLLFPLPILYCLLFAIGLSLILSAISVYFQDIVHLYSVILTLWLYLTPVIYPLSVIEGKIDRNSSLQTIAFAIIKYNPLTLFVEYFRDIIIYNTVPGIEQNLMCLAYGIVFLIIGIFTFNKLQKKFILHI